MLPKARIADVRTASHADGGVVNWRGVGRTLRSEVEAWPVGVVRVVARLIAVAFPPLPLLVFRLFVVDRRELFRTFYLVFELIILQGDVLLHDLRAADLPLLLCGLLALDLRALRVRTS
jgi:hypothetical protein